jgi:DNA polymerase
MNTEFLKKQLLLDALYASYKNASTLLVQGGSNRIIFGEGNLNAKLMLIGEAPGAQEDEELRPFVGRSGKLLNKVLEQSNLKREDVFITNIVKVRPPENRKPLPYELIQGKELLLKQIEIIKPTVICALGSSALAGLLGKTASITSLRGTFICAFDTLIMPTFHPAYILRDIKKLPIFMKDIASAAKKAE